MDRSFTTVLFISVLCLLSSISLAVDFDSTLKDADPLATLPMEQLEQVLTQVKPLIDQATPEQKNKITLLEIRYLAIKGDYDGAMDLFHGLKMEKMSPDYRLRAHDLAVQINGITGDHIAAFTYLKNAQKLLAWADSAHQKYSVLVVGAQMFARAGDTEKALNMATKALHWAEQGGDKRDLCNAWNVLGDMQLANNLLDEATSSFETNLAYAKETGLVLFQGTALEALGDIEKEQGNFRQALNNYQAARSRLQEADYVEGVSDSELGMAQSYFALEDIPSALALLDPMLPKLEAANRIIGLKQAYLLMSRIAETRGDAESALDWHKKYAISVEQNEKTNKAASIAYHQVEFDTRDKEQRISLLEEQAHRMAIEDQSAKQQKALYLLGFVSVLLVSLLLGLLLSRSLREKHEFRRLSQLDPLTGLYNHKKTYELGLAAFLNCHKNNRPFTVAIADIDFFKRVNDNHGHASGDEVLKALTTHMKQHFTGDCIVGRTGGEEFSLFLPGKTMEQSSALIEEFQQALRPVTIFGNVISITMSFGLAMAKQEHKLLDMVIRNADSALYKAKHNGRNRLVHHKEFENHVWDTLPQVENG